MSQARQASLVKWAEAQRKWQQEQYKNVPIIAEAKDYQNNQAAAGAGLGTGSGGAISLTGFAALFSLYEGLTTYAQSATSDEAGNIYTLSSVQTVGDKNNVLRKISSTGVIVWEIIVESSTQDASITPSRIRLSPDGFLYVIVKAGISKHMTDTGNLLWNYLVDTSVTITSMISVAFLSDNTPVTLSDLDDGSETSLLCTWDKITGAKLTEKQFDLELSNQYSHSDILIDVEDNVILALDYNDSGYGTVIIKWNLAEDSEVWRYDIHEVDYDDEDQDVTRLGMDQEGNIYANGYGQGLTKLNSDGGLVWARLIDENLPGLAVSPVGDCYMFGDPEDGSLQVTKISSDGDLQWSYRVTAADDLDDAGWDDDAISKAQWSNGKLYLMARYDWDDDSPEQELILKVSDQQISGVYGPFTFTQYSQNMITVNPSDNGHTAATSDTNILADSGAYYNTIAATPPALQTVEITNLP
jgi:hypothetical protein